MRITESRLRRIIRSVIAEKLDATRSVKYITGTINLLREEEGDLFEKVKEFMKNTISVIVDPEDIVWNDRDANCKKDLMHACRPSWLDRAGEDKWNHGGLQTCEFKIRGGEMSSENKNVTLYNFINTCNQCESFTVRAQLMGDDDILEDYRFGEVVLSIEDYKSKR